jgi:diacylglycerol kinase (ATP)
MKLPENSALLVVYNARSGARADENFEHLLEEKSREYKFRFRVYRIENNECEKHIRQEITSFGPDFLVAAGGDGTLNIVAKIAPDFDLPVMILPLGSANGMARELNIPAQLTAAYDILNDYKIKPIDLLDVNGFTCVHLADVGLNARIVKRFEEDPKRGMATYARHLWREIFLIRSKRFQIVYDGKAIKRKAVSITFANASKYGTGAVINPTGIIDDGKFELCIVKRFPLMKIFSLAFKMFRGNLHTSEYFEVISCSSAKVVQKKGIVLQVDGEVIGRIRQIEISIRPLALKLLLPAVS